MDPDLPVVNLQEEEWTKLYEQWRQWLVTVSSGAFAPHMDAGTGSLSVLGSQGHQRTDLEPRDAPESGVPEQSVHELLDSALRSTEVRIL